MAEMRVERESEASEKRVERAGELSVGGRTTERKKEFGREDEIERKKMKLHKWKMVGS